MVIDTSILINGLIVEEVKSGHLDNAKIIIPTAVIDELQSQASQRKEQGFVGLDELSKLREISHLHGIVLSIEGIKPTFDDIRLSNHGRIDSIIKEMAKEHSAVLYTSDRAQHAVANAEGVQSVFVKIESAGDLEFLKYFDSQTMSVHLKENLSPMAKRGTPGKFALEKVEDTILTKDHLEFIVKQIFEASKTTEKSMIEISKPGATVIQYKDYRIAITRPPFSESLEVTIVHPTVKLSIDDYGMSDELMKRFEDRAEGIIISGPPGSGKSTLASGIANFYHRKGKIVKTFESPRDLQVDPEITQYTKLDGSFENTADILLLVRPDYTVFDEVRRREDFRIFSDLRLTGVGMVGVVHANSPLDAIQRFIGKIELGVIPSVLDTVVFVKDGKISKVYELEFKVKVPSGMVEQDLARPVIEIRNFEDHALEYEIYSYGEENMVVPVSKKSSKPGIEKLAGDKIKEVFRRYDPRAEVQILSDNRVKVLVEKRFIPSIIGKGGSNINDLEKKLDIHIDIVDKNTESDFTTERDFTNDDYYLPFSFSESKTALIFTVGREHTGMLAEIFVNGESVSLIRIGRKGQIRIPARSETGRRIMDLSDSKNDIKIFLKDS